MKHHYFYQNRKDNHDYDKQYFKQTKNRFGNAWNAMLIH